MEITLAHGSGGAATGELIRTVFAKAFDNPILRQMDDSAVVPGSRVMRAERSTRRPARQVFSRAASRCSRTNSGCGMQSPSRKIRYPLSL